MQFIAEDQVHVVIRDKREAIVNAQGQLLHPEQRRLYAHFDRGTAPGWARDIGIPMFEWRRMPTNITPGQWLSYYDSVEQQQRNGWTDEEREAIEQKLLTTHSCTRIERPRLAPPWPAYDTAPHGKIAAKVAEDGYDPHVVIAYEQENKNRPSVIAALNELVGAAPVVEPVEEEDGQLIEA